MKNGKRYRTGVCDDNALEVKNAILNIASAGDEDNAAIRWPKKGENESNDSHATHIGLSAIENLGGMDPDLEPQERTNTHQNIADKKT